MHPLKNPLMLVISLFFTDPNLDVSIIFIYFKKEKKRDKIKWFSINKRISPAV